MKPTKGIVYLVGAGPGDPELITVRGRRLLKRADVIVHDRLIPLELLGIARRNAEIIDVGKTPNQPAPSQERINAILVDRAVRGRTVVRLKGGDPFVFGRGGEEQAACEAAAIPCIVVPGVSSAIAGPASLGIPLTQRGLARGIAIVTGRTGDGELALDFGALAAIDTVVVLMGRADLRIVADRLIAAGKPPQTPAACVERATTPQQRHVFADLASLASAAEAADLKAPVVTVIGDVVRLGRDVIDSGLASAMPLYGRRIVLTQAASSASDLRRRLSDRGARVIAAPLIRIEYLEPDSELDGAIENIANYDWIVFTSQHAVRALARRLRARGWDARKLSAAHIAALGPATARGLRRQGLIADLIAEPHTADALAAMLGPKSARARILWPSGNRAPQRLADDLRSAGALVDAPVAYRTVDAAPPASLARDLARGVDAVVFASPTAVNRFVALGLVANLPLGTIVCIGPTTAAAARDAGLTVDAVASDHTAKGIVNALEELFTSAMPANRDRRANLPIQHPTEEGIVI
jgi:uroporphyrinogen III methyltransferase/synthase